MYIRDYRRTLFAHLHGDYGLSVERDLTVKIVGRTNTHGNNGAFDKEFTCVCVMTKIILFLFYSVFQGDGSKRVKIYFYVRL
jgi:hypothetical protein